MPSDALNPGWRAGVLVDTDAAGFPEYTPPPTQPQRPDPASLINAASRHLSAAEALAAALPRHHRTALVEALGAAQAALAAALATTSSSGASGRPRGAEGRS